MAAPAFSTFSAITELFVTAAVFYVIYQAVRHDNFRAGILVVALTYEVVVNIAYMTYRLIAPASGVEHEPWMTLLLAGHGILSLIMFLGLVILGVAAYRAHKKGRNLFREQKTLTYGFVGLWSLSILSGEAIYVLQYLV